MSVVAVAVAWPVAAQAQDGGIVRVLEDPDGVGATTEPSDRTGAVTGSSPFTLGPGSAEVDAAVNEAVALAWSGRLEEARARMEAAVLATPRSAKAHYHLARVYEAMYEQETDPVRARELLERRTRSLQEATALGADRELGDNEAFAAGARRGLDERAGHDAATYRVWTQGRDLGPGDRGPAVWTLQERLGLPPSGVYGEVTRRSVASWQESSGQPPTGRVGGGTLASLDTKAAANEGATSEFEAWDQGRPLGPIEVVSIDGKWISARTGGVFLRMREAARRDGVRLRIVSGFRTYSEQAHLYRLYRAGRGNLAARPGHSNHQDGAALDLNTSERGVYGWLDANGRRYGFRRTVPSEAWHWELTGK